jgi:hypothetical protein
MARRLREMGRRRLVLRREFIVELRVGGTEIEICWFKLRSIMRRKLELFYTGNGLGLKLCRSLVHRLEL